MAWNTPGGKDKDPWTGRGDQQPSPPDLDEIWRKFVAKFKKLFQQKFNLEPRYSKHLHTSMALVALLVIFTLWLLSGIFIVSPAEQAVVLRFGRYIKTLGAGPHWIPRLIDSKYVVNVGSINQFLYGSKKEPVYLLTKDESMVAVSAIVQYQINNPKDYLFNSSNPTQSLHQAIASAVSQVIGRNTLNDVLAINPAVMSEQIKEQLNQILTLYKSGIVITNVVLQSMQAPEEVKDKFEEASRAIEEEKRLINQANAYAQSILPIAENKAARVIQDASAYKQKVILKAQGETQRFLALLPEYKRAPNVMRERLYLDVMESIFNKTSKIVIDSSANNMIYLPLEQLMHNNSKSSSMLVDNSEQNFSEKNATTQSREGRDTTSGYVAAAEERMRKAQELRQQRATNREAGDK